MDGLSTLGGQLRLEKGAVSHSERPDGRFPAFSLLMSEPIISLAGLAKAYGDLQAVRDLSFQINRGEIFGFLGANGAGKTTTMRMLCGLVRPTSGQATIDGADVWWDRYAVRRKFGYMAQKFSLYPDLTVLENLRFFAGAYRVPPNELDARIKQILAQVDLKAKRDTAAGSLSGGMRRLLALGCALVHEPPLLFLDEPTSGLDPVHRQQMWDLLYDLSHNGITIFVTTHYMDEAERCTEVGFLHEGRLLAKASPRALKATFKAKLLELDAKPVMDALVRLRETEGVLGVSLRSGSLRIYAPEAEKLLADWQRRWPFPEINLLGHRWTEPDMEDVFTAYSQGYDAMLNREALR
jgi:ABC-2 type transport system ATP-binding protein